MTATSATGDGLRCALAEAERVIKKQKTCAAATSSALASAVASLEAGAAALRSGGGATAPEEALRAAAATLRGPSIAGVVASHTKDLHGAVGKLGKAIDRAFVADPDRAASAWPRADPAALDAAIASHLARTGHAAALAALAQEAGLDPAAADALAAPFTAIRPALAALASGDAGPARDWTAAHRDDLVDERGADGADALEFALVRAQFLDALAGRGAARLYAAARDPPSCAALAIARTEFGRFARTQLPEIQRLMGRLVFAMGGGGPVPPRYARVDRAAVWAGCAADLARAAASLAGLPAESPLLVAAAAGMAALPTLHKLSLASALMGGRGGVGGGGAGGGDAPAEPAGPRPALASVVDPAAAAAVVDPDAHAIPVDLDLGPEFVFRSVFSCPVSRDAATPSNPPLLLPCGHALCRSSVLSIAHGPSRAFKCPYCPVEATPGSCRPLRFPVPASRRAGGGGGGGGGGTTPAAAPRAPADGPPPPPHRAAGSAPPQLGV